MPDSVGFILASPGGPSHTGMLQRSLSMDRARSPTNRGLGLAVGELRQSVTAGRVDHLITLDKLKRSLTGMQWPDDSLAQLARSAIKDIEAREQLVRRRYKRDSELDPSLGEVYRKFDRVSP